VCVCIYIYICVCVYIYMCVCIYLYIYVCVCARARARVGHWNSDNRPLVMRTDEGGLKLRSPDGEKRSGNH
jgi:hypothetical protein